MEKNAFEYFAKLDAMGGMVKAIEQGFPQKEIAEASYAYQRAVEAREKIIVGVNDYRIDEKQPPILYIGESVREMQTAKLKRLRSARSNDAVERSLNALRRAAEQEPQANGNGISSANTAGLRTSLCDGRRDCRSTRTGVRKLSGSEHRVMRGNTF
jgi:methylmalonyl-CoA mutase N-terminal domain/subunit